MESLQVFIFNVGQGDNLLLRLPDGSYGFIDFFYDGEINKPEVPPSLIYVTHNHTEEDPPQVGFFHLSHYHFDHLRGADNWLKWADENAIAIRQVWLPGSLPPKSILNRFVEVLDDEAAVLKLLTEKPDLAARYNKIKEAYGTGIFSKLVEFYTKHKKNTEFLSTRRLPNACQNSLEVKACCLSPHSTTSIEFIQLANETMLLKLLSPDKKGMLDENDISAILQLTVGAYKLLFGGDADKNSIVNSHAYVAHNPEVLGEETNLISHFVKVFHHGSVRSSSEAVWDAILPQDAGAFLAISAGPGRYGHPDLETLEHIGKAAATRQTKTRIYSTNLVALEPAKQKLLEEAEGVKYINWPILSEQLSQKQKRKEQSIDAYPMRLTVPSRPKQTQNDSAFLGYCFEFDLSSNQQAIKVYKLAPKPV